MKSEDFQKLKDFAQREISFNEDNALEKTIQLSNLHAHFLNLYSREFAIFKELELQREKIYGELFQCFRYPDKNNPNMSRFGLLNFDNSLKGTEIDNYVKSHQAYYDIALKSAIEEVQVNYLEQTISNINNLGYRITSYVSLLKMKKGIL